MVHLGSSMYTADRSPTLIVAKARLRPDSLGCEAAPQEGGTGAGV